MAVARATERLSIAVALDPAAPLESVLRSALSLAGPSATLIGLFVEDTETADFERCALAREVTVLGETRPLAGGRLRRQLAVRSRAVRLSFEQGAAGLGIRHSFEVLRGPGIESLHRRLEQLDALVISRAHRRAGVRSWYGLPVHRLAGSTARMLLFVQDEWASGRRVALLPGEGERAGHLEGLARRIAAAEDLEAFVLAVAEEGDTAGGLRTRSLPAATPAEVAAALRAEGARVLVLPREHPLAAPAAFGELLRRTDTSILVA
jgi:hypothetical protein